MKKRYEIGSEFWDVPAGEEYNGLFSGDIQWYLSGRIALRAIIKELGNIKSVELPAWCCDSMIRPFTQAGINVKFYPVYPDGALRQEPRFDCDAILIMDYFGFSGTSPDVSGYGGTVIRDVTHSMFSAEYTDADYYFGSLRKWCAIRTGGFAFTGDGHKLPSAEGNDGGYTSLRAKAMDLKYCYINQKPGEDGKLVTGKEYLGIFSQAEEMLDCIESAPALEPDITLATRLDIDYIVERRRENARILMNEFSGDLVFDELGEDDCPMFVPLLVPGGKRDSLRRHLIDNEIYCPVHWPLTDYHGPDEKTAALYRDGLSLVCDQRYGEEDMRRMIKVINSF